MFKKHSDKQISTNILNDLPVFLIKKILNELDSNSLTSLLLVSKEINNLVNSFLFVEKTLEHLFKLTNSQIRFANEADVILPDINQIITDQLYCCRETIKNNGKLEYNSIYKEILFYYVLESKINNDVLGQIYFSHLVDHSEIKLLGIEVEEKYQGKNFGMLLIAFLIQYAQQHNIKEITLSFADLADEESINGTSNFYAKIGFRAYKDINNDEWFTDIEWLGKSLEERMVLIRPGGEYQLDLHSSKTIAVFKKELLKTFLMYALINFLMQPQGKKMLQANLLSLQTNRPNVTIRDMLNSKAYLAQVLELICKQKTLQFFLKNPKNDIEINLNEVAASTIKQIKRINENVFMETKAPNKKSISS